ncbi:hypothetical protein GGG16DRAFT_115047 [Schizophyllum commune]
MSQPPNDQQQPGQQQPDQQQPDQQQHSQRRERMRTVATRLTQVQPLLDNLSRSDKLTWQPKLDKARQNFPEDGIRRKEVAWQIKEKLKGQDAVDKHTRKLQEAEVAVNTVQSLSDEARRARNQQQGAPQVQAPTVSPYQSPSNPPGNIIIAQPIAPWSTLESQVQQQQTFTGQAPPGYGARHRTLPSYDSTYGPPPRVSVDVPLGGLPPPPARPTGPSRASTMPGFSGGYGEPSPSQVPFNTNPSRRHRHTQSAFTGGLPPSAHANASRTSVARTSSSGGRSHLSGVEDLYAQSTDSGRSRHSGQSPESMHSHPSHRSTRSDGTHASSRHGDGSSRSSHGSSQPHSGTSGRSSGH